MFSISMARRLSVWAACALPIFAAAAQVTMAPPRSADPAMSGPSDAKAVVPAALYRSPFTGYQGHTEQPLAPWRDSNELVHQRGGWRAYAREARKPDTARPAAPAASQPAPAATPASAGHAGHEMK